MIRPQARANNPRHLKLASLRGESSNQLFEILEEWNDYLERENALARRQPPP
jgi:hypothetical protein